jgi:hypothetical protein
MVPYRNIEPKHVGKMELLPHAAADTEHMSRVEGAKQAVDQIFDVIQYRTVTNLKGDLPEGYANAGAKTVNGVGKVNAANLQGLDDAQLQQLSESAQYVAAFWGAVNATQDPQRKAQLIAQYSEQLVLQSNIYATLMQKNGLQGPLAE